MNNNPFKDIAELIEDEFEQLTDFEAITIIEKSLQNIISNIAWKRMMELKGVLPNDKTN